MAVRVGVVDLVERVGPGWLVGIGVEVDGVGVAVWALGEFPVAVQGLVIVGDQPLPNHQRIQTLCRWRLVTPEVPEALAAGG